MRCPHGHEGYCSPCYGETVRREWEDRQAQEDARQRDEKELRSQLAEARRLLESAYRRNGAFTNDELVAVGAFLATPPKEGGG